MSNEFTFEKLEEIFSDLQNRRNENFRNMFKLLGADYDRGDMIIVNENLFPEIKYFDLPKQMKTSKYMSPDCPGVVLSGDNKFDTIKYKPHRKIFNDGFGLFNI